MVPAIVVLVLAMVGVVVFALVAQDSRSPRTGSVRTRAGGSDGSVAFGGSGIGGDGCGSGGGGGGSGGDGGGGDGGGC